MCSLCVYTHTVQSYCLHAVQDAHAASVRAFSNGKLLTENYGLLRVRNGRGFHDLPVLNYDWPVLKLCCKQVEGGDANGCPKLRAGVVSEGTVGEDSTNTNPSFST